ncbi:MAG: A/G-specific adenine glycosylase [Planctomycetia bacterium]|nr:A/G-specific adenine glycosylase [Planctomycetia bacterium]
MSSTTRRTRPPDGSASGDAAYKDARWRAALRRRLLAWYRRAARNLPWRRTRDPYLIWVSEIMLQQTVVAAAVPYFERFAARFPTIRALADADEEEVLRLWEGLGYYRRARQLHKAARVVRDEHGGQFPRDIAAVRRLPGVGRYTAGAVLSIAFDAPHPILEANTMRLLARLTAYRGDPRSAAGQQFLWSVAELLLPRHGAGTFNQALMELGSQLCTPRNPQCEACPVATLCAARRLGLADVISAAPRRPAIAEVREAAVIVWRGGRVLLARREAGERWAGLWDFPRFPIAEGLNGSLAAELARQVARETGIRIRNLRPFVTLRHSVTRFRITLECHEATYASSGRAAVTGRTLRWVPPAELAGYPLNTTGRKLSRLVSEA